MVETKPGVSRTPKVRDLVVCVDDERPILGALQRLLRGEPYELLTTDRPNQALDWIGSRNVSLVVSDYRMPEMSGVDLLLAVQQRSPTTERIMLTGYAGERVVLKSMGRGLLWLLSKPWNNDELKRTIRSRLRERRRMERQMVKVGERERQLVAQDLHDTLGQELAGIALMCEALESRLSLNQAAEAAAAGRIAHLVQGALTRARTLARGLCPDEVREEDLAARLERVFATLRESYGVEAHLDWDPSIALHEAPVATHLFWIIQEALTNAVRHGKPRNVWVRAARVEEGLRITIRDDGTGLRHVGGAEAGIGLHIMQTRADAIRARLRVEAHPEGGTEVACLIPRAGVRR